MKYASGTVDLFPEETNEILAVCWCVTRGPAFIPAFIPASLTPVLCVWLQFWLSALSSFHQ